MMSIKPEGCVFPVEKWEVPHPAHWCVFKFFLSVLWYGRIATPRGQAWQAKVEVWTCYMRLRGPWHHVPWRMWRFQHEHRQFTDGIELRNMVEAGAANDIFLNKKYVLREVA